MTERARGRYRVRFSGHRHFRPKAGSDLTSYAKSRLAPRKAGYPHWPDLFFIEVLRGGARVKLLKA